MTRFICFWWHYKGNSWLQKAPQVGSIYTVMPQLSNNCTVVYIYISWSIVLYKKCFFVHSSLYVEQSPTCRSPTILMQPQPMWGPMWVSWLASSFNLLFVDLQWMGLETYFILYCCVNFHSPSNRIFL